ncbi:DUF445 domain-containing protein [Chitinibacteraceae bacterium HSL-7]
MNENAELEREARLLEEKAQRLREARRMATWLLAAAGALFLLGSVMEHHHPVWGYVESFGEAALVGGLADWFAITALFREPMRLPIPHTAIIPKNKARIADSLGQFIETHFLSSEQIAARVSAFNPAKRIAAWLARPSHRDELVEQLSRLSQYLFSVLASPQVEAAALRVARESIAGIDWSRHGASILGLLVADRQHQRVVDVVLEKMAQRLAEPESQAMLATMVANELSYLRWVSLDDAAGRYAARKLVDAIGHELERMQAQPEHPLRLVVDRECTALIARLEQDDVLRERIQRRFAAMLAAPDFEMRWGSLWRALCQQLSGAGDSPFWQDKLAGLVRHWREQLRHDEQLADWVNTTVQDTLVRTVTRYRSQLGRFIADQLKGWDDNVLVERLELNVGVDLQFIRINGTLVGGLIGLLLHGASQLI